MTAIIPTVARMVHFHPASNSTNPRFPAGATLAAVIAAVLPDGKLNLGVFDTEGLSHSMPGVPLIQEGETAPEGGFFAAWMPYQTQVAAGTTAPVLHATPGAAAAASQPVSPSPLSDASKPAK